MKFVKTLLASAALAASFGASAAVSGSLSGPIGSFLSLSAAGLDGGAVATLSGGSVFASTVAGSAKPVGAIGKFLSAGPTPGEPATLTFTGAGVDEVSFLWGSPDTYNKLTVKDSGGGSTLFNVTPASLNFAVTNGNQSFAQYVTFSGLAGAKITSLIFNNIPAVNSFETANYSVIAVPEPETYALMLAGLGAMGFVARRRRNS